MLRSDVESGAEPSEVQRALGNFLDAFQNLEMERFLGCFSETASVFHPQNSEAADRKLVRGITEVESSFRPVFDAARAENPGPPYLNIHPRDLMVDMLGDCAVLTFCFDRPGEGFGRRSLVFSRQAGNWLISHLHASNVSEA